MSSSTIIKLHLLDFEEFVTKNSSESSKIKLNSYAIYKPLTSISSLISITSFNDAFR